MEVARLWATLGIEDREFQRGLQRDTQALEQVGKKARGAGDDVKSFGDRLKKIDTGGLERIGRGLSVGVTAPVLAMGAASIKAASDTDESLSKVNVVFGTSAKVIEEWAKTSAEAFGQSKQQALEAAGTFGNLFTAMQIGAPQASKMSTTLIQLAGDLASFNNIGTEEALTALRAGLVGEAEPLRRLGVNLNEAALKAEAMRLGLAKSTSEGLEPAAKAQAAYSLILQQTKNAQGDFARTSEGLANQTRILEAEFTNLRAEVGKELLPVAKDAVSVARDMLKEFKSLPDPVKKTATELTLLGAALGPVLLGFAGIVSSVKALASIPDTAKGIGKMLGLGGGAPAAGAGTTAATTAAARTVATNRFGYSAAEIAAVKAGTTTLPSASSAVVAAKPGLLARGGAMLRGVGGVGGAAALVTKEGSLGEMIAERLGWIKSAGQTTVKGDAAEFGPKRPAGPTTTAATGFTDPKIAKKLAAASDAQFGAMVAATQSQLAMGDEATSARREAAKMVPLLNERAEALKAKAKELEPLIKEDAEKAKEFWSIRRETFEVQEQATNLQSAAAKEAAEQQKKASEAAKQAAQEQQGWARTQFEAAMQVAQVRAGTVAEEFRAQAEAANTLPLITARQKQLAAEGRRLLPETKTSADAAKRFAEINAEYWSLQEQGQKAAEGASKEIQSNQKKAEEAQKKANREAKKQADDFARFQKDVAAEMGRRADEAMRAFQSKNSERMGFQNAVVSLEEAKLKNNPFLNEKQKGLAMVRPLAHQLFQSLRSVQGESETDMVNRQVNAEGIKSRIAESLGGFKKLGRRGTLALNQEFAAIERQAQATPFASRAVAQAQQAAEQAKKLAPAPVVMQLVVDGSTLNMQKLWEMYQQMRRRESYESGM